MKAFVGMQLLIASVVLIWQQCVVADELLLKKFCSNQETARITSVAQARSLIKVAERWTSLPCAKEIKDSILDLKPVIDSENVCSVESVERISQFFYQHVYRKSFSFPVPKDVKFVPRGVKKFFLAYGFQVSRKCKQSLSENLATASANNLSSDDIEIVTGWVKEDNKIFKLFVGKKRRIEDLLLLKDLSSAGGMGATAVAPEYRAKVHDMQSRCRNHFKPIYDQLVVPIIKLSYLGFSYDDDKVSSSYESFKDSTDYDEWLKAVLVCESLLKIKLVSIKDDDVAASNGTVARLLRDDELAKLEQDDKLDLDGPSVSAPIEYKQIVKLSEEARLVDPEDSYLRQAMKNYRTKLNEKNRITKAVIKKLPKLLKIYVDSGKIKFGLNGLTNSGGGELDDGKYWKGSARSRRIYRILMMSIRIGWVALASLTVAGLVMCTMLNPVIIAVVSLLLASLTVLIFVFSQS